MFDAVWVVSRVFVLSQLMLVFEAVLAAGKSAEKWKPSKRIWIMPLQVLGECSLRLCAETASWE